MRTSAAGNKRPGRRRSNGPQGFTLLELLVVVAIIALGTAGASLALRDSEQTQLERDAQRLAALLEAARAQSRAAGVPAFWQPAPQGFSITGLASQPQTQRWLSPNTLVQGGDARLTLGPEPVIGPQAVVLSSSNQPSRTLRVATDGLRPFAVQAVQTP